MLATASYCETWLVTSERRKVTPPALSRRLIASKLAARRRGKRSADRGHRAQRRCREIGKEHGAVTELTTTLTAVGSRDSASTSTH